MVGDRSRPDGGAVERGITTLLIPPLDDPRDARLHKVLALCEALPSAVRSRAEVPLCSTAS